MRKDAPKDELCICGHRSNAHDNYGTPYARCRDWSMMSRRTCDCGGVGGGLARPAATVHKGKMTRAMKLTRGSERPHALTGTIQKMRDLDSAEITWLITQCDKCGGPFQGDPHMYVLDEDGAIQRPGKPRTNGGTLSMDTGVHVAICTLCDLDDQAVTGFYEK